MATRAWKKQMDDAASYAHEWFMNGCPGPMGTYTKSCGDICIMFSKYENGDWRYSMHPDNILKRWTEKQMIYYDNLVPFYMTHTFKEDN